MGEPMYRTMEESELREWHEKIKTGLEPKVAYDDDPAKMLAAAYEERGKALYYLNHRIATMLQYGAVAPAPDLQTSK